MPHFFALTPDIILNLNYVVEFEYLPEHATISILYEAGSTSNFRLTPDAYSDFLQRFTEYQKSFLTR